jgi:allophanate hydrolase subunit 2
MSVFVVRAMGMVSIQDLGRHGHMHEGLAPGGALVPELLVAANRLARNPDGAAGLEVLGQLVVRAGRELTVATEEGARVLHAGEQLTVTSGAHRATYLALHGGIDAPVVLGGRGVQLSAGIGVLVRGGEHLVTGGAVAATPTAPLHPVDVERIQLVPGPDLDAFEAPALEVLCSAPYRISPTSDRIGTRLDGPVLPRRRAWVERSRPMVRGAIEVPGDGHPIVLGPEHPTTGGYPVIAVVAHAHLGAFFAHRLGATIFFRS